MKNFLYKALSFLLILGLLYPSISNAASINLEGSKTVIGTNGQEV